MMAKTDRLMALYRNFTAFSRFAFRELHPETELIESWHLDVLSDALQRVDAGEITRLMINMPPRTLKSFTASVALPVWMLGRDPSRKVLSITGTKDIAGELDANCRTLMQGPRCHALFPHLRPLESKRDLILPQGGGRLVNVAGGPLIGRGADTIIVDDPMTPALVNDDSKRRALNKWFNAEVVTRLNDQTGGAIVVVMHRLHHDDLCGHLLSGDQSWTQISIPAMSVEDERWSLPTLGKELERPSRHHFGPVLGGGEAIYRRLFEVGAYNFAAHYQQAPYRHMNDEEMRGGCFGGPDDEHGFPTMWFGRVSETEILAHEVFGNGDHHPAAPPRPMTEEEFERYGRWTEAYQRRRNDDSNAEFVPPEGETWPLLVEQ